MVVLYLLQNKRSHAAEIGCLSQLIGCQRFKKLPFGTINESF